MSPIGSMIGFRLTSSHLLFLQMFFYCRGPKRGRRLPSMGVLLSNIVSRGHVIASSSPLSRRQFGMWLGPILLTWI